MADTVFSTAGANFQDKNSHFPCGADGTSPSPDKKTYELTISGREKYFRVDFFDPCRGVDDYCFLKADPDKFLGIAQDFEAAGAAMQGRDVKKISNLHDALMGEAESQLNSCHPLDSPKIKVYGVRGV